MTFDALSWKKDFHVDIFHRIFSNFSELLFSKYIPTSASVADAQLAEMRDLDSNFDKLSA